MKKPKINLKEGGGILKKIGVYAIAAVLVAGIVLGAGIWLSEVDVPISYEEPYRIQMSESETDDYNFETIGFKETTEWAEADFEENDEGTQDRQYHQHVRIDNPADTGHVAVNVEIEEPTGWTDQMGFTVFDGLETEDDLIEPGDEDIEVEYWGSVSHSEAVPEGETKYFTVVYSLSMDAPEPNDYKVNWNFYEGESVNVPDDYDTIGDAIESVDDYTTIFVESNSNPYQEDVTVDKAGITLYGIGEPTVEGSFDLQADDVTLNGFYIDNEHSTLSGDAGVSIGSDTEGVVVSNNIIERKDDISDNERGMSVSGQGSEIIDNEIRAPNAESDDVRNGFWTQPSGDLTVRGNTVENYRTSMNFNSGDEGDFTITIEDNDFHPGHRHGISIGSAVEFNDYDFIIEDNTFHDTGETSISDRHNEYTQNRDVEWREAIVENNDEVEGHEWYLEEVDPPRWILGEAPQLGADIPEYISVEVDTGEHDIVVDADWEDSSYFEDWDYSGDYDWGDNAFQTITDALDKVEDEETILVRPGTYDESLGEEFSLSAFDGKLVSQEGPEETTIDASGSDTHAFSITESDAVITIDGFEVIASEDKWAIHSDSSESELEVYNSIIKTKGSTSFGVSTMDTTHSDVTVENTKFLGDEDGADTGVKIQQSIEGDVTLHNNYYVDLYRGVCIDSAPVNEITHSTFEDTVRPVRVTSSDTWTDPDVDEVTVEYNYFENVKDLHELGYEGEEDAVYFRDSGGTFNELNVNYNNFIDVSRYAVWNEYDDTNVDATYNWWGDEDPDFDEIIEGEVLYEPWLDDKAPYGAPVYY